MHVRQSKVHHNICCTYSGKWKRIYTSFYVYYYVGNIVNWLAFLFFSGGPPCIFLQYKVATKNWTHVVIEIFVEEREIFATITFDRFPWAHAHSQINWRNYLRIQGFYRQTRDDQA